MIDGAATIAATTASKEPRCVTFCIRRARQSRCLPRVDMRRGSSFGSGRRPDAATHAGESAHTPRRSTDGRGRSGGRCAPVARSADNCRADSSARPPLCTPHAALDNAANCGHKGSATASLCRARMLKARGSFHRVLGPSLIRRQTASIAQASLSADKPLRSIRFTDSPTRSQQSMSAL